MRRRDLGRKKEQSLGVRILYEVLRFALIVLFAYIVYLGVQRQLAAPPPAPEAPRKAAPAPRPAPQGPPAAAPAPAKPSPAEAR
ncbi:MAG: hypothetical protein AABZ64_04060 [Nitrospinota bacterium]